MTIYSDEFERYLAQYPMPARLSVIKVCDTAFMAFTWFRVREIPFTGADILTMTGLIMQHEKEAEAQRRADEKAQEEADAEELRAHVNPPPPFRP